MPPSKKTATKNRKSKADAGSTTKLIGTNDEHEIAIAYIIGHTAMKKKAGAVREAIFRVGEEARAKIEKLKQAGVNVGAPARQRGEPTKYKLSMGLENSEVKMADDINRAFNRKNWSDAVRFAILRYASRLGMD